MKQVNDVIGEIEAAFRDVPLGERTLHQAELMDRYATDAERLAARELDPERDWREVPDASIRECPDALSFLDPVSWRFYLPAYMRYSLRNDFETDAAIYTLDPAGIRQHEAHTENRFRTLNGAQARAVCSFLLVASQSGGSGDDTSAREALEDYWSKARGG